MNEIKKLAIALQQKCEEEHVNYGIFFSEVSHTITGGATFTLEEIAIMIETIARNLPVEQIKFLQTVLSMVIEERPFSNCTTINELRSFFPDLFYFSNKYFMQVSGRIPSFQNRFINKRIFS